MITRCPRCHGALTESLPRSCRRCSWDPLELLLYLERGLEAVRRALASSHPVGGEFSDTAMIWAVYNQGVGAASMLRELGLIDRAVEDRWLEDLAALTSSAIYKVASNQTEEDGDEDDRPADVLHLRRTPRRTS